jgi:hypothetical protein
MPARTSPLFTSILAVAAGIAVAMNLHHPPPAPPTAMREELPPLPVTVTRPELPPDRRAPEASEVVQTVYRAFPSALPVDSLQVDQAIVGDFNGDGSPDLAVPARALGARLDDINSEWRNWILDDPHAPPVPANPNAEVPPVVAHENEPLLAVVHGLGSAGWRNPDARQAYLVTANDAARLTVLSADRLPPVIAHRASAQQRPRLRGDLLYDPAAHRFLYWTGGRYAWYPS